MKKKFLSLMMAAAVVATTSVSAFAASTTVDADGGEVNVTVTGNINDDKNKAPEGTISVTIPTALAFTVNSTGDFEGSNLTVVNNGTEKVDIYAYQFVDKDGATGIEVANSVEDNDKRSKVALTVSGNQGAAKLSSTENTNGVSNAASDSQSGSTEVKISTVNKYGESQNEDTIKLTGKAGKNANSSSDNAINKAIKEEFTLRLKVKKATA